MISRRIAAITAATVTGLAGLTTAGVATLNADATARLGATTQNSCGRPSTDQLKEGARGKDVEALQCLLNKNGAKIATDGIFGPRTRAAVREFQSAKKLSVDGIVGPHTWAALGVKNGNDNGDAGDSDTPKTTQSRTETLKRAKTWLTAYHGGPVPYSQNAFFQGYRQDCSGFTSMALQYKGSPNTVALATSTYTHKISMSDLKPGDLVIDANGTNNTRHVVIFEKWNDDKHGSYTAYEQTGDGDRTRHRTLRYGLTSGSEFHAYRPNKYGD